MTNAVLTDVVAVQVKQRLDHALQLRAGADAGVPAARASTEAMLGLQVWAHTLYLAALAPTHDGERHR
jgi:hypothetical protein